MQNEHISARNASCVVIAMILGSNLVLGIPFTAGQDSWASLLIAMAAAIPLVLIYARMVRLMPGKDVFEMLEVLFGRVLGGLFIILLSWYALHLAAMVLRTFSEFTHIADLPKTPQIPIMIGMVLVALYLAKSGIEALGKWSMVMFVIAVGTLVVLTAISIDVMDVKNLLPVLAHSTQEITQGASSLIAFPFGETVLVLALAGAVSTKSNPYKLYVWGIIIGGCYLLLIFWRSVLVLGPETLGAIWFPSYAATRVISAGNFLQSIEALVAAIYALGGITKIAVGLLAASKGVARLFGINRYKDVLVPVGFLALALCAVMYSNIMEMFSFLRFYPYYALPFQIAIPLLMWLVAEIKMRGRKGAA